MRHVLKIGGSNLKTSQDLEHIERALRHYQEPPVLVLSAAYGCTDALIELMRTIMGEGASIEASIGPILETYLSMIRPYCTPETLSEVHRRFDERAEPLKRYLLGIQCFRHIPDFAYHYVCSYGERFATLLMDIYLGIRGLACQEVLPEDCGFFTTGVFPSKEIDFSTSRGNLERHLSARDRVYLLPGFYAISRDHKVSLLGRGGTDYSAASLAYCLGAASLDIWKDVDGFLSADPKLVPEARLIPELSYAEAAELSYFGAKILHPRTMHPVKLGSIPTRIFNIRGRTHQAGSHIIPRSAVGDRGIKSVSHSLNFGILRIAGPDVGMEAGIIAEVSALFSKHELNIKSILTSQTAINFLFEKEDLERANELLGRLDSDALEEVSAIDDVAVLALVGEGFRDAPGLMAKALLALSRISINVEMMVAGASPVSAYLIVKEDRLAAALRAVHQEFFA